jgi:spore coat protein U-like protein
MRLPRWLASFGLGFALLLLASGTAQAQFGNCTITTTSVYFGVYDVFAAAPLDSTGNIHITCFGFFMRTVSVWLSKGNGPNTTHRQMVYSHPTLGLSRLDYNLYLDAAHARVWGDPNPYAYSTTVLLFLLDQNLTAYGRIPQQQDVPAGTYNDTITASINF